MNNEVKEEKPKKFSGLLDLKKSTFDFSGLCCYNNCRRKFYWTYIRNLRWSSLAADFGSTIHKAIELNSKKKDLSPAWELLPAQEIGLYSRERAKTLVADYLKKWEGDGIEELYAETEFTLDLDNGCFYSGKIDRIVVSQGKTWIHDIKTSKSIGQSFFAKYEYPHMQMDGYAWATRALVGMCDGIIIDAISTAENPRTERFQRAQFYRSPKQLADFEMMVLDLTTEVRDLWQRYLELPKDELVTENDDEAGMNLFRQSTTWCEQYGGCPYRTLCAYGDSLETVRAFEEAHGKKEESET